MTIVRESVGQKRNLRDQQLTSEQPITGSTENALADVSESNACFAMHDLTGQYRTNDPNNVHNFQTYNLDQGIHDQLKNALTHSTLLQMCPSNYAASQAVMVECGNGNDKKTYATLSLSDRDSMSIGDSKTMDAIKDILPNGCRVRSF